MQWEIIYVVPGSTDTWRHKPGRLYTPVPRTEREVAEAVETILETHKPARITIEALTPAPNEQQQTTNKKL